VLPCLLLSLYRLFRSLQVTSYEINLVKGKPRYIVASRNTPDCCETQSRQYRRRPYF
jgi:hypothetical protein